MKKRIHRFLIFILLATGLPVWAQENTDNLCYIRDNRICFRVDRRWTDKEKADFRAQFSIDSTLLENAFTGNVQAGADSLGWAASAIDINLIELSKPMPRQEAYRNTDVLLLNDTWLTAPVVQKPVFRGNKRYGINRFGKIQSVFNRDDSTYFFLPGYKKAGGVILSGSFNNWSTMQLPMRRNKKGWEIGIVLPPGKYEYKFITDGHWLTDPNNLMRENDENGGDNSVFYRYNHTFRLAGQQNARSVRVSGSFCNWSPGGLKMENVRDGWQLPLYLPEGTHTYKFIIDGNWVTDPANPNMHSDANGNMNSFLGIGDTLIFRLNGFTDASRVVLSGSFNAWSTDELLMNKTVSGWELPYVLGAGNYEYRFIVDGKWINDPDNPLSSGSGDFVNSLIAFKPNHVFMLNHFNEAKEVLLTGNFNNWSTEGYRMSRQNGAWVCALFLTPGKYTYKFIVDGKWMPDPGNELWEGNVVGTGNSVLWIDP
jgi:type 1 glutamine amidotransferase